MQDQETSSSVPGAAPHSSVASAAPVINVELPAAAVLDDGIESMDVSVSETSEGVRDLEIHSGSGNEENAEEEADEDAEMRGDDEDDSDSDYDFDKDLEEFDEEDDNDELDDDERVDYFESLNEEIAAHTEETERDFYVKNMLAQRDRLTGEEAEWVDQFIREQEEWKQKNNGQSVDTYGNIVKLAKFIPEKLERKPKRPVRSVRK